ncbi:hypothetical protein VARIO8X_160289 [Burkholderiales bacterium 8X]|nr:hypothetical protein VARIO8X_160289 [Burkholderiales bacterium 8X]
MEPDRGLARPARDEPRSHHAALPPPDRADHRRHRRGGDPHRCGRSAARVLCARRERGRGRQERQHLELQAGFDFQPPHPYADRDELLGSGRPERPAQDQVFDRRQQGPRHGQQLRQRQHALGHLPHLRGELGRLLPPHRRHRQPEPKRQGNRILCALRRGGHRPRTVGNGHAGHGRRPLRPLEHPGHRRERDGRLSQCGQHLRLGGRDRSVRADEHSAQAHRARPLRPRRRLPRPRDRRQATRLVHGRRLAQRVHLQVRLDPQLGSGGRDRRHRGRRQVPGRRPPVCRALQRRRHRQLAGDQARRERHHLGQRGLCLHRCGRRAGQHPPGRGCRRRDQDGPPGVDRCEPGDRRGLRHPHQHQRGLAPDRRHRRGQPALLQRPEGRGGHGADRQPERPRRPFRGCRRRRLGADLHLGRLPVRRPRHRIAGHQHFAACGRERLLEPRWHVVQPGQLGPPVAPDRRRRLHRRDQLHDAGRASGQGRRRRGQDHHQRERRHHPDPGHLRRQGAGHRSAAPLPGRAEGLRDHRHRGIRRRPRALREHPASGRDHAGGQHREPGALRQPLAAGRHGPSTLGDGGDHAQRRRQDRLGQYRRLGSVAGSRSARTP